MYFFLPFFIFCFTSVQCNSESQKNLLALSCALIIYLPHSRHGKPLSSQEIIWIVTFVVRVDHAGSFLCNCQKCDTETGVQQRRALQSEMWHVHWNWRPSTQLHISLQLMKLPGSKRQFIAFLGARVWWAALLGARAPIVASALNESYVNIRPMIHLRRAPPSGGSSVITWSNAWRHGRCRASGLYHNRMFPPIAT